MEKCIVTKMGKIIILEDVMYVDIYQDIATGKIVKYTVSVDNGTHEIDEITYKALKAKGIPDEEDYAEDED